MTDEIGPEFPAGDITKMAGTVQNLGDRHPTLQN
jgi:hypothetical protein